MEELRNVHFQYENSFEREKVVLNDALVRNYHKNLLSPKIWSNIAKNRVFNSFRLEYLKIL